MPWHELLMWLAVPFLVVCVALLWTLWVEGRHAWMWDPPEPEEEDG